MSHRVLLVDDSEIDRAVYRSMLERQGAKLVIDEADSAAEAIRRLGARTYDCVFMDHQMPGGDGLSVLNAVRSFNKSPSVMLTGTAEIEVAVAALRAGALDYLVKDEIEAEQLGAALQDAVMHKLQLHARENRQRRQALLQAILLQSEELILIVNLDTHVLVEAGTVGLARIGVRRVDVIDKDVRTLSMFGTAGFDAFHAAVLKEPSPLPTAMPGATLQARAQQLTVEGTAYLVVLARTVIG